MKLSPHLSFNGDCEAALKFYETALGGEIAFLTTWGDTPMAKNVPADWAKKVIHATFVVGGQTLGAADAPPPHFKKAQGFAITLETDDPKEAERLFKALSEKAEIGMPLQETFWARKFGMLTDRFGIPWMINCGKPRG